jgi:hypothetical protein
MIPELSDRIFPQEGDLLVIIGHILGKTGDVQGQ